MTNQCKIDARKKIQKHWKVCQPGAQMRSISINNIWKNDTQKHHEKWCKNEAPQSYGPEPAWRGPWAQSARRGKEFLWRDKDKIQNAPGGIQNEG